MAAAAAAATNEASIDSAITFFETCGLSEATRLFHDPSIRRIEWIRVPSYFWILYDHPEANREIVVTTLKAIARHYPNFCDRPLYPRDERGAIEFLIDPCDRKDKYRIMSPTKAAEMPKHMDLLDAVMETFTFKGVLMCEATECLISMAAECDVSVGIFERILSAVPYSIPFKDWNHIYSIMLCTPARHQGEAKHAQQTQKLTALLNLSHDDGTGVQLDKVRLSHGPTLLEFASKPDYQRGNASYQARMTDFRNLVATKLTKCGIVVDKPPSDNHLVVGAKRKHASETPESAAKQRKP